MFDNAKATASQAVETQARCFSGRKGFNCSGPKCVSTHLCDCVRQFSVWYSERHSALRVSKAEVCRRIAGAGLCELTGPSLSGP